MIEPIDALKLIATPDSTGAYDLDALYDKLDGLINTGRATVDTANAIYGAAAAFNVATGTLDQLKKVQEKAKKKFATPVRRWNETVISTIVLAWLVGIMAVSFAAMI